MKKQKILVIDDEIGIVRYVSACLRKEGYMVNTATDGLKQVFSRSNAGTEEAGDFLLKYASAQ